MGRHKAIILALVVLACGTLTASAASAQTFQSFHCADGTRFIAGFYEQDNRAFLQIDGEAVQLAKRATLSGARYSGAGVTLRIAKTGTTIQHLKRPVTSCEVD